MKKSASIIYIVLSICFFLSLDKAVFSQNNRLWATYYGGSGGDYKFTGNNVATDASGNVYLAGYTYSNSGIAFGGFQNSYNGGFLSDAFLVKFDANGNRVWATYYGGLGDDQGYSVAADKFGNVYLSGITQSTTGIASGGFRNSYGGGWDTFLVKFDAASGNRIWATYYGDSGDDGSNSIGAFVTSDIFGNVYLAGSTKSSAGIASGGFQNSFSGGLFGGDVFLVKFDAASGNRLWATYYGGSGDEFIYSGVASDILGNVYLAGRTGSTSGIASGGFQNIYGGGSVDNFLVKFDGNGARLWATYYGGSANESITSGGGVITDASGKNVYLAGYTFSNSGIASGGFQNVNGGGGHCDAFLVKFDAANCNRLWATYYGGLDDEEGNSVAVDASGYVYLAGDSYSNNAIASGGYQNNLQDNLVTGTENPFLVKFDSAGNRLCATYYGYDPNGNDNENGTVAVDGLGNVYFAGYTNSTSSLASSGAFQIASGGGFSDIFLVKFGIVATVTPTSTSCGGQCNGRATVLPSGSCGNGPYSYEWNTSPIQTTQTATGLCAGTYTVTVTNAGNSTTAAVTITEPSTMSVTITSNSLACNGNTDGSATITANGGSGTYIYSWSNLATTSTITQLASSIYSVTVTDINGCSISTSVFINQPSVISFSVSTSTSQCSAAVGSVTITTVGGVGGYIYSWNNGATTSVVTGLASANYQFTVTDTNGCIQTGNVQVNNFPGVNVQIISSASVTCNSLCNAALTVNASNGSSSYFYLWNNGATTAVLTGLCAGIYTATVTDSNGCSSSTSFNITQPGLLSLTIAITQTSCHESANGRAEVATSGGTMPYIYQWSNGSMQVTVTNLQTGNYTVTVTDANNCTSINSVVIISSSTITAVVSGNVTIVSGDGTILSAAGGGNYFWSPSSGLNCNTCANPIANPSNTTEYCVMVTDGNGCSENACVTITVMDTTTCQEFFFPTAFSPNADINNDVLCFYGTNCIQTFNFILYDRWGVKVFETTDPKDCWDGIYINKEMGDGIFIYYLKISFQNKGAITKKGNITLIQ